MTITKWNHQSEKYSKNINQSDINLWCPKNNCRALNKVHDNYNKVSYLQEYKNTISWKPFFRRKLTFLSKLYLSEGITWQLPSPCRFKLRLRKSCAIWWDITYNNNNILLILFFVVYLQELVLLVTHCFSNFFSFFLPFWFVSL